MKILFICKYNRFRSKFAEAFFNKFNKNNSHKAKSAGLIKGSPIDKNSKDLAKKYHIKLVGQPNGLSTKLLKWQNTIILVADDVPPSIFSDNKKYGKKLIVWKIKDAHTDDKAEDVVIQVKNKVNKLVQEISK